MIRPGMIATVPDVRPFVWALFKRNSSGCCWGRVFRGDGGLDDRPVIATADAVLAGAAGCHADECRKLALVLPHMSRTQRRKLAGQKTEPWRSASDAHLIGGGFRSPCRGCGYIRKRLPPWATYGALFALKGRVYRIVSLGSSNRDTPCNMHTWLRVLAAPISEEEPRLPDAPCTKSALGAALNAIFALPEFRAEDLEAALHVVPASDRPQAASR